MDHTENRFIQIDTYSTEPATNQPETAQVTQNRTLRGQSNPKIRSSSVTRTLDNSKSLQKVATGSRTTSSSRQAARSLSSATSSLRSSSSTVATGRKIGSNGKVESNGTPSATSTTTRALIRRNSLGVPGERGDRVASSPASQNSKISTPKASVSSSEVRKPSSVNSTESKRTTLSSARPTARASPISATSPRLPVSRQAETLTRRTNQPVAKSATSSFGSAKRATTPKSGEVTSKPTGEVTSKTRDNAARNKSSAVSVARQPSPLLHAGRRKSLPVEGKEPSRPGAVPQVEAKANDDVRLDLRGQKVRSLDSNGLSLSPSLEFVYLRDNKLSSLVGIEVLKKVKVLDLSFNEFKGSGFEPLENCKFLQQLYLAGNQITSLNGLPELPNLEFLSVAQNKLKSLAMACQPRLQVLAASKNKISTLRSFPHLPMLEHLRLEENPILEMPHLEAAAIMLVGPTLKKFNDKDLSVDEQKLAKRYPAHTGLCIRDGWDLCPPEVASDSTLQFLLQKWKDHLPHGYILKKASIDSPFEEDACRCHFLFLKERGVSEESELTLKYQWFIAEKTPTDFEKIEGAVSEVYWPKHDDIDKYLKVECTPILGEVEYLPIFAVSSPVSPGTGCPKILSLRVEGDLVEGNIIRGFAEVAWCGGTPGKGVASWLRRRWNSSPVVIAGAEEEDYRLTLDDVDSSLVFMYTPVTEEGTKGEPQYAITDYVKAAFPSVTDVQIIGDLVEGKSIRGTGKYFGGKEGPSKFDWLREDNISGELLPVSSGAAEYLLTEDDVGCSLVFVYSPINLEGIEGKPSTAKTTQISRAPPRVTQLKIMGDLREGNKITISAIVSGGLEGASRVQWFKMNSAGPPLNETAMEAISTSKIAKAFRIPLSAVGHFIVAKYTPVAQDGECGEAAFAVSEKRVETLPPSLNFLSITGEFKEGELLTASYGYIGGHEGSSEYSWYLHQEAEDPGALIPEAIGQLQYQVTKDAVHKFVSFKCIPVRNDGVVGEGRSATSHERVQPDFPSILSLQILGECTEGSELYVEKKYWGGEEGESRIQWYLTSSDGIQHEINGAAGFSYIVCKEDIGSLISVSCEPIRKDGARGTIVFSEHVGPIMPGSPSCESLILHGQPIEGGCLSFSVVYSGGEKGSCLHEWVRCHSSGKSDKLSNNEVLDLTCEDVGSRIELVFTPVRKDGFVGTSQKVVSEVIKDAEPEGIDLIIPHCCEDKEVIPQKSYYGGIEGGGQYTWFRVQSELSNSALLEELNNMTDVKILATSRTYIPNLEDVGFYLALQWVPARKDGKQGQPLITMSQFPVVAAHPTVHNVCIEEISPGLYAGKGDYYGGVEGNSERSWYREKEDGTMVLINGANTDLYQVVDDDYTCRIFFGYLPVRSDGIEGDLCLSEPSNVILPEPPKVQKLVLTGKAVEGEILTAVEVMPNSELQQIIWEKYRKDIKYHWYRSSFPGDSGSFEPLLLHRSGSYKVRLEDVGFQLRCECILTDTFGRTSEPVSVTVGPVSAGIPKVEKLEIEGRGYHTNLYAVRGIYSGGKEGKSKIQWLRSMVGSPDLISIPGEVGRMYEANVDDVGYRLVAIYTPVRDDGIEGTPVSTSTEPIAVEPEVLKEVKQKLDLGAVKFEALRDRDRTLVKSQTQGLGSLERRILEVNRKRLKVIKPGSKTSFPTTEIRGTYAPPFHVELFRNDQHRLKIVIDGETEVDLMVQSRHLRDVIVLVIRGLAQRFNSTSLNSLLKM